MADYRDYILGSRGELSIAKNAYVGLRSGWFSTRSAAYLACGKPIVVQETGFSAHVPPGPGLHPFSTAEEAVAGLAAIRADYARACAHARALAESAFDARPHDAGIAEGAALRSGLDDSDLDRPHHVFARRLLAFATPEQSR